MFNKLITKAALSLGLGVHTAQASSQVEDLSGPHAISQLVADRGFDTPFYINDDHSPKFQVFDEAFKNILGDNPSIQSIAKSYDPDFNAFHEAPLVRGDRVYFSSNAGDGGSGPDLNNRLFYINLKDIENNGVDTNITVTYVNPSDQIQMINGMQPYLDNSIIIATEGRENAGVAPGLFRYEPETNTTTPLLTSFYGRTFNSLNDLKIHSSNQIIFVDSLYGFLQDFSPFPQLPEMVYTFDINTGKVRPLASDFVHPNGIALSPDESVAYVTDTGAMNGTVNTHLPASIYAYDIINDDGFLTFRNRRLFAHALTGVPDGIHCDDQGNVWSGVGDGVSVWDKRGDLLGLINVGTTSANFVIVGDGLVIVLAETEMFAVRLDSSVNPAKLHYSE
ncbi:calcium-dependent phosphotriesterase [Wallemia mellicola]|uniref:Calcium-dependent phosphotriesterase n=1 Tax=Wallemia mellicola TaxID=1708541 RepID=A0A4T0PYF2_9BASI|nr:calcium-dependent phosphotriesterase [Wallemia mellicola]TIC16345.1 calcium-dependent phosphotriesterase [Wallemia mellicola]TIC21132.1 calcium-dependent phosphotriesterase [Wallemia mellicola]